MIGAMRATGQHEALRRRGALPRRPTLPPRAPGAAPRGACACGGSCPKCRAGAAGRRFPGATDDLDNTDLTVPRTGEAGSPAPTGGGASGASCCDRAFSAGLAASDYGGVICCSNVKHSCVWPSNMSSALTNGTARSISIGCAREHEDTHHDDIDCTGAEVERPAFKAGKNARAEECTAYRTEVACFDRRAAECGDDAECTRQITDRRAAKQRQADANCA